MMKYLTVVAVLCLLAVPLCADTYDVTLLTTPLVGSPAGPFSVFFQLTDGSGTGDGNNTAVLNDFMFGGGSAAGSPSGFGGYSGDLTTSVGLTDTSFTNYFQEGFTPGSTLSFVLALTTNVDAGPIPDVFSFQILDRNGNPIPTTAPDLSNSLLEITIDSASPAVQTFGSDTSMLTSTGDTVNLSAPVATPEPGTLVLLLSAVAGTGLWRLRRRKA